MKFNKTVPAKTVLTISTAFIIVYLLTKWHWAIIIALIIGLIGIFSAYLSKKLDFLWMKLIWLINLIVPNILLGIIFYLFLFPISVLSKVFGRNQPLNLKNKNNSSNFKNCNKSFDKASFEKTW